MSRTARSEPSQRSNFWLGLVALTIVVLVSAATFGKSFLGSLFTQQQFKALISDSKGITGGTPVRVAGVQVGKVSSSRRIGETSELTVDLNDAAPSIRQDATLKLRPRIFLEGNFFIDLDPGSPSSPEVGSKVIPLSQTSVAVQAGEVLEMLDSDTRKRLSGTIQSFGDWFSDPAAVQAMREISQEGSTAFKPFSKIVKAMGGNGDDLNRVVENVSQLNGSLKQVSADLGPLVKNIDQTFAAFANSAPALQASIPLLRNVAKQGAQTFTLLDAAMPSTLELADQLQPTSAQLAATAPSASEWSQNLVQLLDNRAAGGWVAASAEAMPLINKTSSTIRLLGPKVQDAGLCVDKVLVPAGNAKIADGPFTTNRENYKNWFYWTTGAGSASQGFDANGVWARTSLAPFPARIVNLGSRNDTGKILPSGVVPAYGVRPVKPQQRPPYRDDVKCYTQPVPNPNLARYGVEDASQLTKAAEGTK